MYVLKTICAGREACSTSPSLSWNSTISQIFSQIFHIPTERTRVTNAPFYHGKWSVVKKKRKVKELWNSASKFGAKVFMPNQVSTFVAVKVLYAPLIFARDSIFVQLTRRTISWVFLITLMSQRDNVGDRGKTRLTRERAHLDFFFSLLLGDLCGRVLHVLLCLCTVCCKAHTFFWNCTQNYKN